MININYRKLGLPVLFAAAMVHSATVLAAGASGAPNDVDDSGFTLLSDTPNVTHWGLGAGLGYEESPYAGYGSNFSPLPLVFFDDKWLRFYGDTLDLKVIKWDGLTLSLRGKYDFGAGYNASDAPILDDMETRIGAFWYGPSINWQTGLGTLTADFLTAGSKGRKADVQFGSPFHFGRWTLEPHIGAEWLNNDNVDYYYGVTSAESRPWRDQYQGKSSYNFSAGARLDYRFTRQQSFSLDAGVVHLGSGITDSPLVDKTVIPQVKLIYLYQFQ